MENDDSIDSGKNLVFSIISHSIVRINSVSEPAGSVSIFCFLFVDLSLFVKNCVVSSRVITLVQENYTKSFWWMLHLNQRQHEWGPQSLFNSIIMSGKIVIDNLQRNSETFTSENTANHYHSANELDPLKLRSWR